MPSLEQLEAKWKSLASEIAASARLVHNVDASNPHHIELLEVWLAHWGERD